MWFFKTFMYMVKSIDIAVSAASHLAVSFLRQKCALLYALPLNMFLYLKLWILGQFDHSYKCVIPSFHSSMCINYFSVVIEHNDQGNFQRRVFKWATVPEGFSRLGSRNSWEPTSGTTYSKQWWWLEIAGWLLKPQNPAASYLLTPSRP